MNHQTLLRSVFSGPAKAADRITSTAQGKVLVIICHRHGADEAAEVEEENIVTMLFGGQRFVASLGLPHLMAD